jgi:CMP-N-acetylneuraminic acid synthetase
MAFVLGVIPARAGSKRCPGKNKRLLGGKPLVVWTIEAAQAASKLTFVVGTTDDPDVMALFANRHMSCIMRPAELATDAASVYDVIWHAVERLGFPVSHVCLLQPTSPFRTGSDIDRMVALLDERSAAYTVGHDGKPNGAVYVAEVNWLREHGTFADGLPVKMWQPVDIDTEEDWLIAERVANA